MTDSRTSRTKGRALIAHKASIPRPGAGAIHVAIVQFDPASSRGSRCTVFLINPGEAEGAPVDDPRASAFRGQHLMVVVDNLRQVRYLRDWPLAPDVSTRGTPYETDEWLRAIQHAVDEFAPGYAEVEDACDDVAARYAELLERAGEAEPRAQLRASAHLRVDRLVPDGATMFWLDFFPPCEDDEGRSVPGAVLLVEPLPDAAGCSRTQLSGDPFEASDKVYQEAFEPVTLADDRLERQPHDPLVIQRAIAPFANLRDLYDARGAAEPGQRPDFDEDADDDIPRLLLSSDGLLVEPATDH